MLANRKHNSRRYRGYATPFCDEIYSERIFLEGLRNGGLPAAPYKLFAIDRQVELSNGLIPDLLTLDATGTPWIFEFKRDIADAEVISQVMVYASNIASQDVAFFKERYSKRDKRRELAAAFKSFFGNPLPQQTTKKIRLVIAAYDFSVNCRQALDLLSNSTGVTIGRLSIKCIHTPEKETQPCYDWIVHPTPFSLPKFPDPPVHHWVSVDARRMGVAWNECLSYEFLPVNGLKATAPVLPGHGVFVYLRNLEPNNTDSKEGLAGLGIVDGPAFDLHDQEDQFKLSIGSFARLNQLPQPFKVLPIRWIHRRTEGRQCSNIKDQCGASEEKILVEKLDSAAQVDRAKRIFTD